MGPHESSQGWIAYLDGEPVVYFGGGSVDTREITFEYTHDEDDIITLYLDQRPYIHWTTNPCAEVSLGDANELFIAPSRGGMSYTITLNAVR